MKSGCHNHTEPWPSPHCFQSVSRSFLSNQSGKAYFGSPGVPVGAASTEAGLVDQGPRALQKYEVAPSGPRLLLPSIWTLPSHVQ